MKIDNHSSLEMTKVVERVKKKMRTPFSYEIDDGVREITFLIKTI